MLCFALLVIITSGAGCAHAQSAAPSAPAEVSGDATASDDLEAIRAVGRHWRELYASGRFAEIPDLYTVDTLVMPRGRPRIEGREQMRRAIGGLAAGRRVAIEVTEREAWVSGDYGWFVGDFRVTYSPPDPNAAPTTEYGRSLVIFRRDSDGRWRIHRDMDSPAPHPAPAVQPASAPTPPPAPPAAPAPALWDPSTRTTATACDRMTASRYDRTRLAPPVARESIDVPAAIAQCEADLAALPGDPRILFQLGRVYGYAGDTARTLQYRQAAAAAGNANAIFLLGYLSWNAATDDAARCAAAREMKLAADRGNYSAQLTYASFYLEGRFDACADRASNDEVAAYVAMARPAVDGFFETRFADHLAAEMASHDPE
jgi:ketosteroid isomerase-like protein